MVPTIIENQMEKKNENEMETGWFLPVMLGCHKGEESGSHYFVASRFRVVGVPADTHTVGTDGGLRPPGICAGAKA